MIIMFEFAKIRDKPKMKSIVTHDCVFNEFFLIYCHVPEVKYDIYMSNGDMQYDVTDLDTILKTIVNNAEKRVKSKSCRVLVFVSQINCVIRFFPDAKAIFNKIKDHKIMCLIDDNFEIRDFGSVIDSGVSNIDSMIDWMGVFGRHPSKIKLTLASNAQRAFYNGLTNLCWKDAVENRRFLNKRSDYIGLISGSTSGLQYAKPNCICEIFNNVVSFDKKSAYPSIFVSYDSFPIGRILHTKHYGVKKLFDLIKANVWFQIVCDDLPDFPKQYAIWFKSKRYTTFGINNFDFKIIESLGLKESLFSSLDKVEWQLFYSDEYGYLIDEFREKIVDLYYKKESETNGKMKRFHKKQLEILFGKGIQNDFIETDSDVKRIYSRNGNRYLLPSFSRIAISAVKYELFRAVLDDPFFLVCNTDGIKSLENLPILQAKFDEKNEVILEANKKAGFDGCSIGTWKHEYTADRFIMVSVERYMYEIDSKVSSVVSGVPNEAIVSYTSKEPDPLVWLQKRPQIEFTLEWEYDSANNCYKPIKRPYSFRS